MSALAMNLGKNTRGAALCHTGSTARCFVHHESREKQTHRLKQIIVSFIDEEPGHELAV